MLKIIIKKRISEDGMIYSYEKTKTLFGLKIYKYEFDSNCFSDTRDEVNKKSIGFNKTT